MASIKMNQQLFQELTSGSTPVLVDFSAPWCGYCRRIDPAYELLADQYEGRILVAKVNIDDEPALAEQERIELVPTLVLYQNGKALGEVVAPGSKAQIEEMVERLLK
jgi:thioredoxin